MRTGLSCQAVTVHLAGALVLDRVVLDVAAGSATALVGPSGAGKTTLLRALAGLTPVATGRILLDGRDLTEMAAHRRRVGYVFQDPRLLPHLDVLDNVALPLRAAGVRRTARRLRARELLDEVRGGELAHRRVEELSGGQQQRVALARALATQPDLLLLDEPLSAVDPGARARLRRLIRRVQRERAVTTIVVTHDRSEAAELGDRVAVLLDGRIAQHDTPRQLFDRPACRAVAAFMGSGNLIHGPVVDGRLSADGAWLAAPGPDGLATLTIRPERVVVGHGPLRLRVESTRDAGTHVRAVLRAGGLVLEAHVPPHAAPAAGTTVAADLPLEHLWRLPDDADAG